MSDHASDQQKKVAPTVEQTPAETAAPVGASAIAPGLLRRKIQRRRASGSSGGLIQRTPTKKPAEEAGGEEAAETKFKTHDYAMSTTDVTLVKGDEKKKKSAISESPAVYTAAILKEAGLDAKTWYSQFTNTTFLGRSVSDIHTDLATHLKSVEGTLLAKYGGTSKDPETAAKALGLTNEGWAGGRDHPTSAPISMHLFGLAVDVNYTGNPFISDNDKTNAIFGRAGELVTGTKGAFHAGMSFDALTTLDDTLVQYFAYMDDDAALTAKLVDAKGSWAGKDAAAAKKIITADYDKCCSMWERTNPKQKDAIKKAGFLNLKKEFVDGIGLDWGGKGYGDMMHFDMRNKGNGAKIQSAVGTYKAAKEKESKETYAKDHADP